MTNTVENNQRIDRLVKLFDDLSKHSHIHYWNIGSLQWTFGYEWWQFSLGIWSYLSRTDISVQLDIGPFIMGFGYTYRKFIEDG